jgi:SOS response regulatory protein OraA/RecX
LTAVEKALQLLARKARTAAELDAALERAHFSPDERKTALARMKELGYIDDRVLARARARSLIERGKAPWFAARKLEAQGVALEDARAAAREIAAELGVAWKDDEHFEDD